MAVYMVYDANREGAVTTFINDAFGNDIATVPKQIVVGDAMICRAQYQAGQGEPTILASIERKRWEDFAQGFCDGRYENKQKMIALREKTGCQLFYILEGNAFPHPNTKFSRVPARNITAACFKLMVRDGIYVIQTEDQAHTARVLYNLCKTFQSCIIGGDPMHTDNNGISGAVSESASSSSVSTSASSSSASSASASSSSASSMCAVPALALEREEESDEMLATKMWANLPNISIVQGSLLTKKYSVADLMQGRVAPEVITSMKTANHRAVNKNVISTLNALKNNSIPEGIKLLAGIRGITKDSATQILASCGSLHRLTTYTVDTMKIISASDKQKKLGPARASMIHKMLHFCTTNAQPAAVQLPTAMPAAATPSAAMPAVVPAAAMPAVVPAAATPAAAAASATAMPAVVPAAAMQSYSDINSFISADGDDSCAPVEFPTIDDEDAINECNALLLDYDCANA